MATYKLYLNKMDNEGNPMYYMDDNHEVVSFKEKQGMWEFLWTSFIKIRKYVQSVGGKAVVEVDGKVITDEDWKNELEYINLSNEEVDKERVKRLKKFDLEPIALKEAIKNHTFYVSENMGMPFNVNYFLDGYTYEKEVRRAIELLENVGGVPYWGVVDHFRGGGIMVSLLYVSPVKTDWDYERLQEGGYIQACVYNSQFDDIEIGDIQVRSILGGLKRVG